MACDASEGCFQRGFPIADGGGDDALPHQQEEGASLVGLDILILGELAMSQRVPPTIVGTWSTP